jgi:hypothetical protein
VLTIRLSIIKGLKMFTNRPVRFLKPDRSNLI